MLGELLIVRQLMVSNVNISFEVLTCFLNEVPKNIGNFSFHFISIIICRNLVETFVSYKKQISWRKKIIQKTPTACFQCTQQKVNFYKFSKKILFYPLFYNKPAPQIK